jgi:hypothetical protein
MEIAIMVEETIAVKKTAASKKAAVKESASTPVKKAVAAKKATTKAAPPKVVTIETAEWPFPEIEKAPVKKKAVAKKSSVADKSVTADKLVEKQAVAQPSAQERYRMVETAAYYIAERSNFQGNAVEHWAQAELEISTKLSS